MAAINYFHLGRCANLNLLNKAIIVLTPKKDGADSITDCRLIGLIHSFVKIISKILALRLVPKMHEFPLAKVPSLREETSMTISYTLETSQGASIETGHPPYY